MEGDSITNSSGGVSISEGSIMAIATKVKVQDGDIVVATLTEFK
jgi:SOS-response transcriptional repressor LexA